MVVKKKNQKAQKSASEKENLKGHWQIPKKRCFKKYCSCDKANFQLYTSNDVSKTCRE